MTERQPWPVEQTSEFYDLLIGARKVQRMARAALDHGINGGRNLALLEKALRDMVAETKNIRNASLQAERNRRRWPRWPTWALTVLKAAGDMRLVNAARRAEDMYKRARWGPMESAIGECEDISQELEALLLSGPEPEPVRTLVEVAEEIVEEVW